MINEVKEEAKRRIANALFGSYALSWCAFNYQLLIVLFSPGDYEKKIGYITNALYKQADWASVFGWPALVTLIYLIVSPTANVALDLWATWVRIQGDNLAQWAETKRWGTDEELRTRLRNRGFELDTLRRRAAESITLAGALRYQQLSSPGLETEVRRPKLLSLSRLDSGLSSGLVDVLEQLGMPHDSYAMLKLLTEHDFRTEEQILRDSSSHSTGSGPVALSFLLGAQLIELIWKDGPTPCYAASQQGRQLSHILTDHYSPLFN